MKKFTMNWKLVVLSGMMAFQTATAKIEDDFAVLEKGVKDFSALLDAFFNTQNKQSVKSFIAELNTVKIPFKKLIPIKGVHYTKPEETLRSMIALLHGKLEVLTKILEESTGFLAYLNIGTKLASSCDFANLTKTLEEQFRTVITLVAPTHPELTHKMMTFETNTLLPLRAKWNERSKKELLDALKHRCQCK